MKAKGKRMWARLLSVLVVLALLPGMFVVSFAGDGDYREWCKDYAAYGYDPYEKYYEEWDVPTVLEVYTRNGEKAADNYIGLFKISVVTDDPSWVQSGAANLDTMYPPSENTPAPSTPAVEPTANPWHGGGTTGQTVEDKGIPVYDDEGNVIGLRSPEEGEPGYEPPPSSNPEPSTNPGTETTVQYFPDVAPDAWYAEAVNAMAATGLIKGYEDGTFRPENTLTEGEWCTIIWRIVGGNIGAPEGTVTSGGGHTSSHWASRAVFYCEKYEYTNMCWTADPNIEEPSLWRPVGTYFEDQLVNRGEAATSIMRIVDDGTTDLNIGHALANANQWPLIGKLEARQKKNGAKTDWVLSDIPDAAEIEQNVGQLAMATHKWNVDSIVRAYNLGILNGMDKSGTCDPHGTLTRAQACQMLYNALITEPRPIRGRSGGGLYG